MIALRTIILLSRNVGSAHFSITFLRGKRGDFKGPPQSGPLRSSLTREPRMAPKNRAATNQFINGTVQTQEIEIASTERPCPG